MKKSIKWTAVVSTAAVMAAMTPALTVPALAQTTGWTEEDGTWRYYDSDGYLLTDSWKKNHDSWYYLDEEGKIALNTQIDNYYVGADGRRVTNQWVSVENEDYWDDENDAEYNWFYYGSNGKMTVSKFKTIDGKTYYFGEDGRMMTGLQNIDGSNYYFGKSTDGVMRRGWVELELDTDDPDVETAWSYFNSDGKRIENQVDKRIGDYYYTFVDGRMVTGWYKLPEVPTATPSESTDGTSAGSSTDAATTDAASADTASANAASTDNAAGSTARETTAAGYQYYDESGRRASGWMDITGIPGVSAEEEIYRFYFKNGVPHFAETGVQIFGIGSDRYAFNRKGEMQTGLQVVTLEDGSTANYYFDTTGAMKTGKQTIFDEDLGVNQNWFFQTDGSQRGRGFHGIRSNTIYQQGLRLEADADLRYAPVTFEGQKYLVNASGTIQKASSSSKSSSKPELGSGYKDLRDSNDTVWTVDVNGVIQQ